MKIFSSFLLIAAASLLFCSDSRAQSTIEIKGCIAAVGPAPGYWAGVLSSEQPVDYEVMEVRSGSLSASQVQVLHAIVAPGGNVDAVEPKLDESIFAVGNVVVVPIRETTDPVSGLTVYRNADPVQLLNERCVPGGGGALTGSQLLALLILVAAVVVVAVLFALRRRRP